MCDGPDLHVQPRQPAAHTLESLAAMDTVAGGWDVLVVDNNSTDDTEQVVASLAQIFRSAFDTSGNASGESRTPSTLASPPSPRGPVVAFTDDDVVVSKRWLAEAVTPLLVGSGPRLHGRSRPPDLGGDSASWLPKTNSNLWGTIAAPRLRREPFIYEERRRIPIGANMAVRRSVFDRRRVQSRARP